MSSMVPGKEPLAYLGIKETNPPQLWFRDRDPLITDYSIYDAGDLWVNNVANRVFVLIRKSVPTGAIWQDLSGSIETIQGDAGLPVSPDAANILHFEGNSGVFKNGVEFTGFPAGNTVTAKDLRNVTMYVVDFNAGETEYTTIQSAINAAVVASIPATVYIRPGTYTENLTLASGIDLIGAVATPAGYTTTIVGTHTPPAAGTCSIRNLGLVGVNAILNSAVAGTTTIALVDCLISVTNGFTLNLPNWVGVFAVIDVHCQGAADGFINNATGASTVLILNSTIGFAQTQTMTINGYCKINSSQINPPISLLSQSFLTASDTLFGGTFNSLATATAYFYDCVFATGALPAINTNSPSITRLSDCSIESAAAPAVITGTGAVQFGSVTFLQNIGIAATIVRTFASEFQTGFLRVETTNANGNLVSAITSVAGSTGTIYCANADLTSDPLSNARVWIETTSGAGDPFLLIAVQGITNYSLGIDNSASDVLKITDNLAGPSAGNTLWQMTPTGQRTMPLQPCFSANQNTGHNSVTGNNTLYTVVYNQMDFQQGAGYNNATGIFTAPVTGIYHFEAYAIMGNFAPNGTYLSIQITLSSGTSYIGQISNPLACQETIGNTYKQGVSCTCTLAAGGTAQVQVRGRGLAGDTMNLQADGNSHFSGFLVC